ncbi:D-alanine--D-alanine ligase [Candidatus Omnitrophota bacterium]
MARNFGRVGVLMGGPSSERGISIRSGTAVYNALISSGIDALCIDPRDIESGRNQILESKIDVAFVALHGRFGEDGTIQQLLEDIGVPYTGSGPRASALAIDKILSKKIFQEKNIPVPKYTVIRKRGRSPFSLPPQKEKGDRPLFPLPFVVKPAREGSSIGLSLVEREDSISEALDNAFLYDDEVLIEEYIPSQEITAGILDDKPLPVVHIKPKTKFYSFKAKYESGMSEYVVPADFSEDIIDRVQDLALASHRALGCSSFSRVDMLLDKRDRSIVVLEVNTIPGLTASSLIPKAAQAAGIDFAQVCLRMIKSALVGV